MNWVAKSDSESGFTSKFLGLFFSPEIVNKGIFSQKYAVYTVSTVPFKYEVKRRYRDFEWLRNILIREYPTTYVDLVSPRFLRWPKKPIEVWIRTTWTREQKPCNSSWIKSSNPRPLDPLCIYYPSSKWPTAPLGWRSRSSSIKQ